MVFDTPSLCLPTITPVHSFLQFLLNTINWQACTSLEWNAKKTHRSQGELPSKSHTRVQTVLGILSFSHNVASILLLESQLYLLLHSHSQENQIYLSPVIGHSNVISLKPSFIRGMNRSSLHLKLGPCLLFPSPTSSKYPHVVTAFPTFCPLAVPVWLELDLVTVMDHFALFYSSLL